MWREELILVLFVAGVSALSPLAADEVDHLLLSPNVRAALFASSPPKVVPEKKCTNAAGDAVWCMQWAVQPGGLNCYDGHGAPGSNGEPHSTSVRLDECKTICQSLPSCGAIVVKFESNADRMLAAAGEAPAAALVDCYLREEVRVAECVHGSAGYELFTLQRGTPAAAAVPTASPTAMPKASPKASPRASPEARPAISPRASPTASPKQTAPAKKASVTASPTPQLASPQPASPRPERTVDAAEKATVASETAADAAELAAVAEAQAAAASSAAPAALSPAEAAAKAKAEAAAAAWKARGTRPCCEIRCMPWYSANLATFAHWLMVHVVIHVLRIALRNFVSAMACMILRKGRIRQKSGASERRE